MKSKENAMQIRSQAMLEKQLVDRERQLKNGEISDEQAFSHLEDWMLQLEERKAFLHPNLRQWMWYDNLHEEWIITGYGVGEAILIAFEKIAGAKKLPQAGEIDQWCAYYEGQAMHGPLRVEELSDAIASKSASKDLQIWSTRADRWLRPFNNNGTILLCDASNNPLLVIDESGHFVDDGSKDR
jgi:hypothetical protein